MESINGRPGTSDAQRDIGSPALQESRVNMGLNVCGRRGTIVHAGEKGGYWQKPRRVQRMGCRLTLISVPAKQTPDTHGLLTTTSSSLRPFKFFPILH